MIFKEFIIYWEQNLMLFEEENKQKIASSVKINKIDDPLVKKLIGEKCR